MRRLRGIHRWIDERQDNRLSDWFASEISDTIEYYFLLRTHSFLPIAWSSLLSSSLPQPCIRFYLLCTMHLGNILSRDTIDIVCIHCVVHFLNIMHCLYATKFRAVHFSGAAAAAVISSPAACGQSEDKACQHQLYSSFCYAAQTFHIRIDIDGGDEVAINSVNGFQIINHHLGEKEEEGGKGWVLITMLKEHNVLLRELIHCPGLVDGKGFYLGHLVLNYFSANGLFSYTIHQASPRSVINPKLFIAN